MRGHHLPRFKKEKGGVIHQRIAIDARYRYYSSIYTSRPYYRDNSIANRGLDKTRATTGSGLQLGVLEMLQFVVRGWLSI